MSDSPDVLYRKRGWLAVFKPAGIPTTAPPSAGVISLTDRVKSTLAPQAVYVHPLSRLDVEVTGVVLYALDAECLNLARKARESGKYRRRYLALLAKAPEPPKGEWNVPIGVDPKDPKRRTAGRGRELQQARTLYTTLDVRAIARVALDLETGRTHQIRVHASHAGCPILGDRLYGGPRHLTLGDGSVVTAKRVMLHAERVVIPGSSTIVRVDPPEDFEGIWSRCAEPQG